MRERVGQVFDSAREWRRRNWHWLRWPTFGAAGVFALVFGLFAWLWFTVDLPDELPELSSSVVVDSNGEQIAVLSKEGQRYEVDLDEVAPVVVDALIAAEDRRFYEHGGIDPLGIARAAWHDVRNDDLQGGSTLTQQLVKNSFLSSERTFTRKAKEAVLSIKLERTMDKDEILERYLNTVYFGRGAYGIEAAARLYYGTSASDLDLPQAALLIGLLTAPESADPELHPEVARERRASVLSAMVANGAISQADADRGDAAALDAVPRETAMPDAELAAHFVDWVRQQAVAELGEARVFEGGLRIVTTLDLEDQRAAEESIAAALTETDDPEAALVALGDDGAIRAYVGSRDHERLKVDLARGIDGGGSGRQPGSTFKPFVLAAALADGTTLADRFAAPPSITVDVNGAPWEVENYDNAGMGEQSVLEATASSTNTVYAQLLAKVGPEKVVEAAEAAGIDSELEPHAAIALGAEEVSPLEMAESYLTFANRGSHVQPYAIERIEVDGETIWEPERPTAENSVDEDVADTVNAALQQVVSSGTGRAAQLDRPVAGKTGTTQNYVDAWFAGYTPSYAAVVWMGYPDASTPMDDVHGRSVTGGSIPAEIWQSFMSQAVAEHEVEDFVEPPSELVTASTSSSTSSSSSSTSTTREKRESTTTSTTVVVDDTTTTILDEETTTTTTGQGPTTTAAPDPEPEPAPDGSP